MLTSNSGVTIVEKFPRYSAIYIACKEGAGPDEVGEGKELALSSR